MVFRNRYTYFKIRKIIYRIQISNYWWYLFFKYLRFGYSYFLKNIVKTVKLFNFYWTWTSSGRLLEIADPLPIFFRTHFCSKISHVFIIYILILFPYITNHIRRYVQTFILINTCICIIFIHVNMLYFIFR